jgi:hypothetical protein
MTTSNGHPIVIPLGTPMRPRAGIAVIGLTRSLKLTAMRSAVVVAVVLALSSGCATIRRHSTLETEQMLSAAGFHMKLADTPEKLAHLQTLTPRRLVPHRQADQVYYVYADPEVCRCLYAGTEAQYQAYQQLALQKQRADEALMAAQTNLDASMDWGMWGPWPWY